MAERLYTVQEVAQILHTNASYVYKLKNAGLLSFLQIGRFKCRESVLDAFIAKWDGWDITDPFHPVKLVDDVQEGEE